MCLSTATRCIHRDWRVIINDARYSQAGWVFFLLLLFFWRCRLYRNREEILVYVPRSLCVCVCVWPWSAVIAQQDTTEGRTACKKKKKRKKMNMLTKDSLVLVWTFLSSLSGKNAFRDDTSHFYFARMFWSLFGSFFYYFFYFFYTPGVLYFRVSLVKEILLRLKV